jgi:hypothetical protein
MGVLAKAAGSLWDWIEAGYPEEVAKRIVSGELPMDEASRLARAQEQGYGPVLYRGHSKMLPPSSSADMFMTDTRAVADTYANAYGGGRGTVTPLRHNASALLEIDAHGYGFDDIPLKQKHIPRLDIADAYDVLGDDVGTESIAQGVRDWGGGNDGVRFKGIVDDYDPDSDDATLMTSNVENIFGSDPDVNIRHADAAYDPQYTGSNIMGNATVPALGVLATGTGAALAAPALKSEGLEKATGFLDETIRSARHAAGPLSFLVPYEGISNFAKKWNADEDLTWQDYLGLLDF